MFASFKEGTKERKIFADMHVTFPPGAYNANRCVIVKVIKKSFLLSKIID